MMFRYFLILVCFSFVQANVILKNSRIEGILDLRDPFEPPKQEKNLNKVQKSSHRYYRNGMYTNRTELKDIKIQELDLENLNIIGILQGEKNSATVRMKGESNSFILKEGMKFGKDGIELKTILPGGLIFVKKQPNLYGDVEYQEIIVPIQKEGVRVEAGASED